MALRYTNITTMTKLQCLLLLIFMPHIVWAGFANYNSVLIGERAAGMGGAFAAMTNDPAACSFYNPATLARMEGSTLSASVNVYNKYAINYGDLESASQAPLQINQGTIVPIPSSSGSVYTFRNMAFGLSIVVPDFDIYIGDLASEGGDSASHLNLWDESLWIGGTYAINISEKEALGVTIYYTSRSYNRSVTDQQGRGTPTLFVENKVFSNNSLIYMLGYWHRFNKNWSFGASYRFPSLEISGRGSYTQSQLQGDGSLQTILENEIRSETKVPAKALIGLGYQDKKWMIGLDFSYYSKESYIDMDHPLAGDLVEHKEIWNFNAGAEYFINDWVGWRFGLYTNHSSHPKIPSDITQRFGDNVDMWGWSTNIALYTSNNTTITLGGYYTGGSGHSVEQIGRHLAVIDKSIQVFTFLVATGFQF